MNFLDEGTGPFGELLELLIGWARLVGVGAEGLDGVYAVIDEMFSAGHGDPCVAGGDHVRAGMGGEDDHSRPEDDHG